MKKDKIKPMVRLSQSQIKDKLATIEHYIGASNAATGSLVDSNSNVSIKTNATLGSELLKDFNIQINRAMMHEEIKTMFSEELADKYINDIESHVLYCQDETRTGGIGTPYCVAISMYPFLEHGMLTLGGESKAPQHLASFTGSYNNLMYSIASQFAGAVASVEYLLYFDYFARKDFGDNYLETHKEIIEAELQNNVYTLNQPAGNRSYQSIFWNISVFDKYFYDSIFGNFMFPDMSTPNWKTLEKLQEFFLFWLKEERKKALLTFPVLTEASINENGKPKDEKFAKMIAKVRSEGLSLFSYNDTNAAALSSCCRLKNEVSEEEKNEFSFSLGAGGVSTGSTNVITINLHRLAYNSIKDGIEGENVYNFIKASTDNFEQSKLFFVSALSKLIDEVHQYQTAHRNIVKKYIDGGLLPVYTAKFITLDKQFCTLGINGLNECAELFGMTCNNNDEYKNFITDIFSVFSSKNKEANKKYGIKFNTEMVPAEGLGPKNAKWDKKDGILSQRECYNSYIYLPEDTEISIIDKFELHGGNIISHLDGGSALHLNIANLPDEEFFYWLRCLAAEKGTNYWTSNVMSTICEDCGAIDFRTLDECSKCKSKNINFSTRVIGYNKKIKSFAEDRQAEAAVRHYH